MGYAAKSKRKRAPKPAPLERRITVAPLDLYTNHSTMRPFIFLLAAAVERERAASSASAAAAKRRR